MRSKTLIFATILAILLIIQPALAASNESIQAKKLINAAQLDIKEMQMRNISIVRVNESLQRAIQQYSAQLALEESSKKADYSLVSKYVLDISQIKSAAFRANDELQIFKDNFAEAGKETNLSEMSEDYQAVLTSFSEERFEDTLKLIEQSYTKISDIQSKQTALRAFYDTTSRGIKSFFINNWLEMLIILAIIFFVYLFFGRFIKTAIVKTRISNLYLKKSSLNGLIKKLQNDYFRIGKISESEYHVKIERFKEISRDVERQISIAREDLLKLTKGKKIAPRTNILDNVIKQEYKKKRK